MKTIPVHSKTGELLALVDDADHPFLSSHNWHEIKGYARNKKIGFMHQYLMPDQTGIIDHANRNKLDNQRDNLRIVNSSESNANRNTFRNNTSGHRGVSYETRIKRWRAWGKLDGTKKSLGCYTTREEAIAAYHNFTVLKHGRLYCCI